MVEHLERVGRILTTSVGGESVHAYIPRSLPPGPPLELGGLLGAMEVANRELGRLDGIATVLPSTSLFLWMYVRKEALLSS